MVRLDSFAMRVTLAAAGVLVLAAVYVFQRFDYSSLIATGSWHPNVVFIVNRTVRLILNDLACMLLIFAIFQKRQYLVVAFYVFLFELLILLPVYFTVKLSLEGDSEISSPMLSFIHRLIVNPMLMVVLIGGFFYQRLVTKNLGT
jgi:exosortase F-associated protein